MRKSQIKLKLNQDLYYFAKVYIIKIDIIEVFTNDFKKKLINLEIEMIWDYQIFSFMQISLN